MFDNNVQNIEELTTEEKIKLAAAKVFIKKGYAATKTRDIAEEAGINIASLHYYYRSKDKLFDIVIGEALSEFSQAMDEIFGSEVPLHEKIRQFVDRYIDFFKENPYIPVFIMSESQNNPEKVDEMIDDKRLMPKLAEELKMLAMENVIRPIAPAHFFLNIISLTAFPFLAKPLMTTKMDMSDEDYTKILDERKSLIPEIIINFLYIKKPF